MTPRAIFEEWSKGCTCTNCPPMGTQEPPWKCDECTEAMMGALANAFEREKDAEQDEKTQGTLAMLGGHGPIESLRKRFGSKIDDAVRRELGDVCEQRDNAETANHGLRVELYMAQQLLAGANASIQLLARGAGIAKSQHLHEMAEAQLQLAAARARMADLERALAR